MLYRSDENECVGLPSQFHNVINLISKAGITAAANYGLPPSLILRSYSAMVEMIGLIGR